MSRLRLYLPQGSENCKGDTQGLVIQKFNQQTHTHIIIQSTQSRTCELQVISEDP